jgi:hypothetical protein
MYHHLVTYAQFIIILELKIFPDKAVDLVITEKLLSQNIPFF